MVLSQRDRGGQKGVSQWKKLEKSKGRVHGRQKVNREDEEDRMWVCRGENRSKGGRKYIHERECGESEHERESSMGVKSVQ